MIPFDLTELLRKRQGLNPADVPPASAIKKPPVVLPEPPQRNVQLAPPVAKPPQGGATDPSYDQGAQIRDYRSNRVIDEVDFARDQYVRKGMGEDGKVKRNWKTILANALLGAGMGAGNGGGLGGALGGAAAAGLVSAVNPLVGREFMFNQSQAPSMYQSQERERENRQSDQAEAYRAAQIESMGAMEAERRANVELRQARAEAVALGKPVYKDIPDSEGNIWTHAIYPDGRDEIIGKSGTAQLKREGYQSQERNTDKRIGSSEKIAEGRNKTTLDARRMAGNTTIEATRMRQQGANYRTGVSQSGQDRRLNQRLSADGGVPAPKGGKPLPAGMIEKFMKRTGRSREEAVRMAQEAGYDVR